MSGERRDLEDILGAIREVEANLESRGERASGANMMIWGLAASTIFLFYHLVEVNPRPWVDLLGRTGIRWFWTGPSLVAYVASALVGARLGRIRPEAREARDIRALLVALLVPFGAMVYVSLTGNGDEYAPGLWVAFLGFTFLLWCRGRTGRLRGVWVAASAASFAVAALLLVLAPAWGNLAAGVHYALALVATGAARYHSGS